LRLYKYLLLALGASLMFGTTSVYAGKKKVEILNYWFVGATDEHTLFHFIDASTVTYDGPTRSAWITAVAAGKGIQKYGMRRSMILTIFNCERNSLFQSRVTTYDQSGVNLLDHSYDNNDFRQIAPGSVEATEVNFVCANPENWASGKNWAKIDVPPELMSDRDNQAFQLHQTP